MPSYLPEKLTPFLNKNLARGPYLTPLKSGAGRPLIIMPATLGAEFHD
jgi:hypothetical protein